MIWWPIALPAALALLIAAFNPRPNLRELLAVMVGVLNAAIWLNWWVQGPPAALVLLDWLPGLSMRLELEPLGLLFGTVAAVLWPLTTIYAAGYMRGNNEKFQQSFFTAFAASIAGAQLIALAGDLITLFVGYEWLTLATWPLVTHKRDGKALQGGRTYLGFLLATSLGLLLPAIVISVLLAGRSDFTAGGLLTEVDLSPTALAALFAAFMFGTGKAALMPIHRWLPAAMVAPTPVSALLHAVAVVKAGVFVVLKVTIYVFSPELLLSTGAAQPVLWVAAISLVLASVQAWRADHIKQRLAYSTVSQLAYVSVAACLLMPQALLAGSLQILAHACGKITLFFCAGAIYTAAHKQYVSELDGLGWKMPFTFAAFGIAALSIIGLPPGAGSWVKWYLSLGTIASGQWAILAVLAASTMLNIAYLLPIPLRGFLGHPPASKAIAEAPLSMVLPLCITAALSVFWFFGLGQVIAVMATLPGVSP
nr:monovalent cation/H+ antiporter subunit D family protein [Oceanococcus sp. HetDA_MAG_MS8]